MERAARLFFNLALAVSAGVFAYRNRAVLAHYLRAGGREARSSGAELLARAGLVERPSAPLPRQPSAALLGAPADTLRIAAPGAGDAEAGVRKDRLPSPPSGAYRPATGMSPSEAARANARLHVRRDPVAKEPGGAEYVTADMNSPWKGSQEEEVSFWHTQLGVGIKWSAGFSLFFLLLGTLLMRGKGSSLTPKRWT